MQKIIDQLSTFSGERISFSIVIPTYNRADLIMETLNSVFEQGYKNYEVIVVDNCSTDDTEALLAPLAAAGRIIYVKHAVNHERAKARNTGMEHASGDYLTLLDSDDFMYPSCLQDAADFAQEHKEIKFFQNKFELVNNKRESIYRYEFPSLKNQYKALASGNFISCIGGFMHKEVYHKVRFNEDPAMIGSEDYELWFEVLSGYKMGRVDKINSGVREHVNRSIHHGAYDNIEYQKKYIIEKIKNNEFIFNKFSPYLNRLQGSFILQQIVVLNQLGGQGSWKLLGEIIRKHTDIIYTKRFFKVLYNTIKS